METSIHALFSLMYLTGHSRFLMQAGNLAFPINVHRNFCVSLAFAQTTSDTLFLAFFFPRVLPTFSKGISKVHLGSNQKNKPVSFVLYAFLGSYFAIMAYNVSKTATRFRIYRSIFAPSP